MRVGRLFFLAILLGLSVVAPSTAKPLYDTPIYYPPKHAYYELVKARPGNSVRGSSVAAMNWHSARVQARQKIYKGLRGRLAIIDDRDLNDFLRKTFTVVDGAWIGLRYYCNLGLLMWVNGRSHPRSGFKNWGTPWRSGLACDKKSEFAPIYVTGTTAGFVWKAQGYAKEMPSYFVEYREVDQDGN